MTAKPDTVNHSAALRRSRVKGHEQLLQWMKRQRLRLLSWRRRYLLSAQPRVTAASCEAGDHPGGWTPSFLEGAGAAQVSCLFLGQEQSALKPLPPLTPSGAAPADRASSSSSPELAGLLEEVQPELFKNTGRW